MVYTTFEEYKCVPYPSKAYFNEFDVFIFPQFFQQFPNFFHKKPHSVSQMSRLLQVPNILISKVPCIIEKNNFLQDYLKYISISFFYHDVQK